MTKSQGTGASKYVKKADVCGEAESEGKVASYLPYFGVRTRAKTLALKNLQESSLEAATSYLQLRGRRLEKHPCSPSSVRSRAAPTSKLNVGPGPSRQIGGNKVAAKMGFVGLATRFLNKAIDEVGYSLETSVGENVLEFGANRSDRETTPSSLIRNSEAIEIPGLTTRPTYSTANKRRQLPITSSIPSEVEMERLFAGPERLQQRRFMEKYNFDFVNEKPLPGRYEWAKLDCSSCRQTKRRI